MQKIHHYLEKIRTFVKNNFYSRLRLSTPSAVIIGSVLISLSIVAHGFIMQGSSTAGAAALFTGRAVDATDYIEGEKNSNVVLVEYSDPECPYCISVHPTIKQLRNDYRNKVAFVYRHFPLTQIHPHAFDESKAITCAGTLGGEKKMYEYIDALYGFKIDHQTTQLPTNGKEDIARGVGLDSQAFTNCINAAQTGDTVNNSINDGLQAGVQGTPSSFVLIKTKKGYEVVAMIDGARDYTYFQAAIDEALQR